MLERCMSTYGSLPIHGLLALDPASAQPLYRQLYDSLRAAILAGQLVGGARLPSTRALAEELGASRSTVINAFDQLLAEGYIYGVRGSGTYVVRVLPEELLHALKSPSERHHPPALVGALSQRGAALSALLEPAVRDRPALPHSRAFPVGLPAIDEFPRKLWGQLLA